MSSNLKVNTILPSTGTTIGIGTVGGLINVVGNIDVNSTSGISTFNGLEISGIVTAKAGAAVTYYGDGSNLTGITDNVVTINGNTDHYVVTATGTANTLQGESTLLFNNGRLDVTQTTSSSDAKVVIRNSNTPGSGSLRLEFQYGTGNVEGTNRFRFGYVEGYRQGGSNDGGLKFGTKPGNADAPTERLRINPKGQISIRGTTTAFDTTGDLDSLQLYYETDSGQASIGPYSSGGSTHLSFYTNSGGAAATEKLRIRSDGKISAGTSLNTSNTYEFSLTGADATGGFYAHGRNHYLSNRSNAYASLTLKKSNSDSDATDYFQLRDSSNNLKASISGAGNWKPIAGGGIDFSATGDSAGNQGSSELLDDYEEGSWTPAFKAGNNSTACPTTVNEAKYTRVGRLVTATAYFTMSSYASGTTGGDTRIVGLPYQNIGDHGGATINYWASLKANVSFMAGTVQGGTSEVLIRGTNSANTATANLDFDDHFGPGDSLILTATYHAS